MRAIAVLTVFANHLFDWPPGGFVGVDVFFVLSGFFITGILIRERTTERTLSFQNFYVRRVKRILPSAMLVLTATVVVSYLLLPAIRAKETLLDALYAAVFAANVRFEAVGADYFQQGQMLSPLRHYWSLSIEEQFYFVWPALLVLIFALSRQFRPSRKAWARQWVLLGAMSGIVAASFGWAMFLSAEDPNRAYFSTFTRVWELGIGALVAIAGPWLLQIPSSIRPLLAYLGLAGVVGSLFLIDSTVQFPAPWAALPVLSTALVASSFHGAEVRGMFLLSNPVARYFGDTSYTLYLWHWPVIVLLDSVIPRGLVYYVVTLTVALGLTAVTYRFYEDPIRKSDWLLAIPAVRNRRVPTLTPSAWGLIGSLGAAMIVLSILGIGYVGKLSAAQKEIAGALDGKGQAIDLTQQAEKADPCFGAPAMLDPGCVLRNPDVPLQPSVDEFFNDLPLEAAKCYTPTYEDLLSCDFGYMGDDATRIALVGDSHATFLIPALRRILNANKWRLTTYTGHECVFMDPAPDGCRQTMASTRAELLAHPYDVVLFTNYNNNQSELGYESAWAPIATAGSRIAAIADNPESSEDAIACLTRFSLSGDQTGECGTPKTEAFRYPDPLVAAAQVVAGTTLIDLTPYYCTTDRCPSVIGNVIVYRDTNHITATFAKTLAQPLEDGLRRALAVGAIGSR
ncbi:acyltransferase [Mycolicibacterium cyprinidarum]|nr:acyltransferase [Mycolicibacterium sp. NGTWS1803]